MIRTGNDLETDRRAALLAVQTGVHSQSIDQLTVDALRVAAAAGGAAWSLARADGRTLAVPLGGSVVEISGDATPRSPRRWLEDFWLALLVDDFHALAALCYAPPALRGSDPAAPHLDPLAEAVRRYWLHDSTAPTSLLAALRDSDPAPLARAQADRALDLDVPLIEALFALFERNAAKLDRTLAGAFTHGRAYWDRHAEDPEGWFALPLAAVIAQARRVGLTVTASLPDPPALLLDVESPYALLLCPYCVAPLVVGMHLCPACLEDTTHDAWFESDVDAFHANARARCPTCSTLIARLAVRCPSCRSSVPAS